MTKSIVISAAGRLRFDDDPEASPAVPDSAALVWEAAFRISSADGLLSLLTQHREVPVPPSILFWREFSRRLVEELRRLSDGVEAKWTELPTPSEAQLAEIASSAPPMRGLEYLTPDVLRNLWRELHAFILAKAEASGESPAEFLHHLNPLWHLVGRVTFHLAENKRDEDRPFAFLATYTHRVSAKAKLQHLPLAEAVKQYAHAHDQAQLAAILEPVRRAAEKSEIVRELLASRMLFQAQAWNVRQAYRFLSQAAHMQEAGVVVRLPDWWRPKQPTRPKVQVSIGGKKQETNATESLLDFRIEVVIDGEPLTEREYRDILQATEKLVLLRGKWVEVDGEKLQQALEQWQRVKEDHGGGLNFMEGMRLLAGETVDGDDLADEPTRAWSNVTAGPWLRDALERLRNPGTIDGCRPGRDLQATLRPYQSDGVRWLWFMTRLGLGACLADDMGLGKTVQVIDLMLQMKRETGAKRQPPHLLIVPASLVGNWRQEFERFAPSMRVLYAHRSECDAETLARIAKNPESELQDFDAVVTTYTRARSQEWLAATPWRLVVLDEAQAIKNASSAQTRAVKRLESSGRILLSGTPVENHLGDLWSLFDFCNPGLLGSAAHFKKFIKRLDGRQDAEAYGALRRLVRPYILRRMKTDPNVVPDLPEKTEMRVDCGLAKRQAVLYEKTVADLARRLNEAEGMQRRGLVLGVLMQLKQICNHASQYLGDGEYAAENSGKFQRLAQLCEPIVERQERMLVFTQFQTLCEPLAEYLRSVFGAAGLVLHGGTPVVKRKQLVKAFQDEAGPPFFVISLKAGGSGLNLTAASHVVHFDRWWNPAVENQATDRAFRIGQKRNVLVHKFVCRGTLEERIDQLIRDKQSMADQVLGEGAETLLTEMSNEQLLNFVSLDIHRAGVGET